MGSHALGSRQPRRPRPPLRHILTVVAVWVVVVGAVLVVARTLDSPVGEGARDEAQPAGLGQVATPPGDAAPPRDPAAPGEPAAATLPPFAMVLDRPLPPSVAGLDPVEQAEELRTLAMQSRDPDHLVELGTVMQVLGDRESAEFSYRSALRIDPANVAARVGLAVAEGHDGADALARSAGRLEALAADHPDDQLVAFNQAWVEIYREQAATARSFLDRTVALGPDTRLGRTAAALLSALESVALTPGP